MKNKIFSFLTKTNDNPPADGIRCPNAEVSYGESGVNVTLDAFAPNGDHYFLNMRITPEGLVIYVVDRVKRDLGSLAMTVEPIAQGELPQEIFVSLFPDAARAVSHYSIRESHPF